MRHIASLSYGKDSIAMLEAIRLLGYPLDEIIHVEIWATDTVSANLPEMQAFKSHADRIIKERYGLDVQHVCARYPDGSKVTFEREFYKVPERRKKKEYNGLILGWPMVTGRWCLRALKLKALPESDPDVVNYVGIAADETRRIANTQNSKRTLPLVDIGWTEADAMAWCREHDLVSPVYRGGIKGRDGCFFCPMQGLDSLRNLRRKYPDLWSLMLRWDIDSPVTFGSDGRTLHDYDKRFELEDMGLINPDRRFRWKMIEMPYRQQVLWR